MIKEKKEEVLRLLKGSPIDYVMRKTGATRKEVYDVIIEKSGGIPKTKVEKRGYRRKSDAAVEEKPRLMPEEKLGYVRALEVRLFAAIENYKLMPISKRKGSDLEKDINEMVSEYCRFVV